MADNAATAAAAASVSYNGKTHWMDGPGGRFVVRSELFQCYGLLRRLSLLNQETRNGSVTLRLPEALHPLTSEQYTLLLYSAIAEPDAVFVAPLSYQDRYEEMYELFKAFEASEAVMNKFQIGWYRWQENKARVARERLEAAAVC